mgnify:CR=1 FL=1
MHYKIRLIFYYGRDIRELLHSHQSYSIQIMRFVPKEGIFIQFLFHELLLRQNHFCASFLLGRFWNIAPRQIYETNIIRLSEHGRSRRMSCLRGGKFLCFVNICILTYSKQSWTNPHDLGNSFLQIAWIERLLHWAFRPFFPYHFFEVRQFSFSLALL